MPFCQVGLECKNGFYIVIGVITAIHRCLIGSLIKMKGMIQGSFQLALDGMQS
jgi:hypothetical protein